MKMIEKKISRKGGIGGCRGKQSRQKETGTREEKHYGKYETTKRNEGKNMTNYLPPPYSFHHGK